MIAQMATSPVLRSRSPQELTCAETETPTHSDRVLLTEDEKHRSLSPKPLRIVQRKDVSVTHEPDLEANWQPPSSVRSSGSNYSTPFAGPSQAEPAYQPYCKPESPPLNQLAQRGFLEQPSREQLRVAREKLQHPTPFADEDEDDLQLKELRRGEALRMLVENSGRVEMQTGFHGNGKDTQSTESFDFASVRARKVLEEKRQREGYGKR
jgi:hypothetical protein